MLRVVKFRHGFCTLLLYFIALAYLFSPDEGSCCIFSNRNNCCEFLASDGVICKGSSITNSIVLLIYFWCIEDFLTIFQFRQKNLELIRCNIKIKRFLFNMRNEKLRDCQDMAWIFHRHRNNWFAGVKLKNDMIVAET